MCYNMCVSSQNAVCSLNPYCLQYTNMRKHVVWQFALGLGFGDWPLTGFWVEKSGVEFETCLGFGC